MLFKQALEVVTSLQEDPNLQRLETQAQDLQQMYDDVKVMTHYCHHAEVGETIGSEGTKGIGGGSSTQGGSTGGQIRALARGSLCAHNLH